MNASTLDIDIADATTTLRAKSDQLATAAIRLAHATHAVRL